MKLRRELISGLLAALVSIIIIGGSFAISFAENGLSLALAPTPAFTSTIPPTVVIPTTRPGEPTHTPSPSPHPATPTSLPSPTSSCPMPSEWVIITLSPGDTLNSLAQLYNITPEALAEANCLVISKLTPGTTLYVPGPLPTPTWPPIPTPLPVHCGPPQGWVLYTVQQGDTLYSIGVAHGVNVAQLQAANCMGHSTIIKVGQRIYVPNVPTKTPSATATATPTLTPTLTPIPPTATHTLEATTAVAPSDTPTPTATVPTETPSATPTPTNTSTDTPTPSPTLTPTFIPSPTDTGGL
ncbi:MAG: LysM peptidoglycan-binding domain-containing protein [Chloroflexi bacterium]|nr:LysM peptidoglycan-binding domain-containing protein [Chloroflexota bacterium]MBU1660881.1 LysM peptidoglycan-binding domain-containing protein [Chloroflexota bacterium]